MSGDIMKELPAGVIEVALGMGFGLASSWSAHM
jgi:hypothetical protein